LISLSSSDRSFSLGVITVFNFSVEYFQFKDNSSLALYVAFTVKVRSRFKGSILAIYSLRLGEIFGIKSGQI
jgi:hypothetical protein